MADLSSQMKVVLADTFQMYFKAHSYHWNVTGMFFPQLHEFFGTLYEELWGAIDLIAEHTRTLDSYAPRGLDRIVNLTTIPMDDAIPVTENMIENLLQANEMVLQSLMLAHQLAEADNKRGIVNFLEERIDIHDKHGWMLKAIARK